MRLTKHQRFTLAFYLDHRDRPPTSGEFFRRYALALFLRVLIVAVSAVACDVANIPSIGFLVAGLLIGATLRDWRHYYYTMHVWPLIQAIVEWERAARLLEDAESAGS